jgi:hypothetical protein
MNGCDRIAMCAFYNDELAALPAAAELYKQRYCRGDSSSCARRRIVEVFGVECVPPELYPTDSLYADTLLARVV